MNNTVFDIDYTRTLPPSLKDDESMLALARGIAGELQENIRLSRICVLYPRIDELEENLLDVLAYDLHVDWYEYDSPIDVKREILKDSVKVHKRLGTKYAVESVVRAHFGSGIVREWYEYGGEPHHFRIISGNPSITDERAAQFFQMLDIVKRKSSWLDSILITLTGDSPLYLGVMLQDFTREAHIMGAKDKLDIYVKAVICERAIEKHAFGSEEIACRFGTLLSEKTIERHTIKEE